MIFIFTAKILHHYLIDEIESMHHRKALKTGKNTNPIAEKSAPPFTPSQGMLCELSESDADSTKVTSEDTSALQIITKTSKP